MRATSRWLVHRILPSFEYRTRILIAGSLPAVLALRSRGRLPSGRGAPPERSPAPASTSVLGSRRASCPSAHTSAPASCVLLGPRSQQRDGDGGAGGEVLAGALAAAGRGRGRGDDVLDAEPG